MVRRVEAEGGVFPRFEKPTDWIGYVMVELTPDEEERARLFYCPEHWHRSRQGRGPRIDPKNWGTESDYQFNMALCGRKFADVQQEVMFWEVPKREHFGSPMGRTVEGMILWNKTGGQGQ